MNKVIVEVSKSNCFLYTRIIDITNKQHFIMNTFFITRSQKGNLQMIKDLSEKIKVFFDEKKSENLWCFSVGRLKKLRYLGSIKTLKEELELKGVVK